MALKNLCCFTSPKRKSVRTSKDSTTQEPSQNMNVVNNPETDRIELARLVQRTHLSNRLSRILPPIQPPRRMRRPDVIFHFVRSTEAYHNSPPPPTDPVLISSRDNILDPHLTNDGISQAEALRNEFPYAGKVSHVLVSPLARALETMRFGFNDPVFLGGGYKVVVWPDLRELGHVPCNWGSALQAVIENTQEQGIQVDVSLLTSGWKNFEDPPFARSHRVYQGLKEFQCAMLRGKEWGGVDILVEGKGGRGAQEDVHVLVVGHGALMKEMLGVEIGVGEWKSCVFERWVGGMGMRRAEGGGRRLVEWRGG